MINLLIYSAYYEPDVVPSMYLFSNLCEDIAASGINTKLYVPLPSRGISDEVRTSYKGKNEIREDGNLKIIRLNFPKEGKNSFRRALRYLWMNIVFICVSSKVKADVIFVQSTPPTQGAMAAIIKKRKKIPFVYNLQDIFPDSLVGAGMASEDSLIYKIGRKIENFTYKHADRIIVISGDMKNNIQEKGVTSEKIDVISNWVDGDVVYPVSKDNNYLYDKYGIAKDKFTVVYAGNLGYAQNIEVIIKAAEQLKEYDDLQFIIFGKGVHEDKYRKMASKLENISFFPIQPYSEVSYVYSLGDVSIVPCKKGFGGSAMPSKTWSIMATGTPVLASYDSGTDLERLILSEQVGLFSEADDVESLVKSILELYSSPERKDKMGFNARNYVLTNMSREICTRKYIEVIRRTVSEFR